MKPKVGKREQAILDYLKQHRGEAYASTIIEVMGKGLSPRQASGGIHAWAVTIDRLMKMAGKKLIWIENPYHGSCIIHLGPMPRVRIERSWR